MSALIVSIFLLICLNCEWHISRPWYWYRSSLQIQICKCAHTLGMQVWMCIYGFKFKFVSVHLSLQVWPQFQSEFFENLESLRMIFIKYPNWAFKHQVAFILLLDKAKIPRKAVGSKGKECSSPCSHYLWHAALFHYEIINILFNTEARTTAAPAAAILKKKMRKEMGRDRAYRSKPVLNSTANCRRLCLASSYISI